MKDSNLSDLTKKVRDSFALYDRQGTTHWTWETAAKDLAYQVGSLTKITSQLAGERWADNKTEAELKQELQDELADILAEVLYIASELKIDLVEAIDLMTKSDQEKVKNRTTA